MLGSMLGFDPVAVWSRAADHGSVKSIPSPAMVVALIALFVALGGTAAALSGSNTVFSDDITNDQVFSADVRNDTLAGGGLAAADLQAGSVGTAEVLNDTAAGGGLGASDLGPGSVGPSEVIDNSLTGADINESTLSGVAGVRIDSEVPSTDAGPLVKVLQSKGLTLSTNCFREPLYSHVALFLKATGPAGSVMNYSGIQDISSTGSTAPPEPYLNGASLSATPTHITEVSSGGRPGNFGLNYIHGVYRSASNTVSFEINAVATEGGGGICQFHGTATPTP